MARSRDDRRQTRHEAAYIYQRDQLMAFRIAAVSEHFIEVCR